MTASPSPHALVVGGSLPVLIIDSGLCCCELHVIGTKPQHLRSPSRDESGGRPIVSSCGGTVLVRTHVSNGLFAPPLSGPWLFGTGDDLASLPV